MVTNNQKKKLKKAKKREWFNKVDLASTLFLMVLIFLIVDVSLSYAVIYLFTDGSNRQAIKCLIWFTIIFLIVVYLIFSKRLPKLINNVDSSNRFNVISSSYNVISFTTTIILVFILGVKNNIYAVLEFKDVDIFVWDFFLVTFVAIINILKYVFETKYRHYVK